MYQNICNFIDKEMKDLDHRIIANGKLTMQEVQYMDLLSHAEKSLLTNEAMKKAEEKGSYKDGSYKDGYSEGYSDGYNDSHYGREEESYSARGRGRGARRDSMGRYADEPRYNDYGHDNMMGELKSLMEKAPNEQIRRRYSEFMSEIQGMM